jgi:hypothetical protein
MPRPAQPTTDHMQAPEHTVQTYDSVQRRSRAVPILTAAFILTLLLITGAMYLYGSMLVNKQPLTETFQRETSQMQQEIPTNGFQVTESGATEPNFDATTTYPTTTPQGVNTDTMNMFQE